MAGSSAALGVLERGNDTANVTTTVRHAEIRFKKPLKHVARLTTQTMKFSPEFAERGATPQGNSGPFNERRSAYHVLETRTATASCPESPCLLLRYKCSQKRHPGATQHYHSASEFAPIPSWQQYPDRSAGASRFVRDSWLPRAPR